MSSRTQIGTQEKLSGREEHAIKRFQAVRFTHSYILRSIDPPEIQPLVLLVPQHRRIRFIIHRRVRRLPLLHGHSRFQFVPILAIMGFHLPQP
eukprot:g13858.t1